MCLLCSTVCCVKTRSGVLVVEDGPSPLFFSLLSTAADCYYDYRADPECPQTSPNPLPLYPFHHTSLDLTFTDTLAPMSRTEK